MKIMVARREAAQMLSIALPTLDKLRREGRIPCVNLGRAVRFRVADLEEYAQRAARRQRAAATAEAPTR